MIDVDQFRKITNKLYDNNRDRWRKVLQKGMPKGVALDIPPAKILPFSREAFQAWLWEVMGLQAILCPYCRRPIDIISMQLDHKIPLRRGGGPEIANLQPLCKECNGSKGEFTHEEYAALVVFMESAGAAFRKRLEGVMRNGGMATMMRFFPRKDKKVKESAPPPLEYEEF